MAYGFLDIAVTPAVRAAQERNGVAEIWEDFRGHRAFDRFDEPAKRFIEARDSFYLASTSETGWPYVQHRGGARGFLRVLDDVTLAFPDYRGNRQYISLGNLSANDKASLFLMDYPNRTRLKIYARVKEHALDEDPGLTRRVLGDAPHGRTERIMTLHLESFDWNCPQYIVPRFTADEIEGTLQPIRVRLAALEAENEALKERLGQAGGWPPAP
jgi:predicted pyridoxine 5'-phosphate oxidase superfamily flavin-nucleotide-binding protein